MLAFIRRQSLIVGCLFILLLTACFAGSSSLVIGFAFLGITLAAILGICLSFCKIGYFLKPYRRTIAVSYVCSVLSLLCCFYFITYKNEPVRALAKEQTTHHITAYAYEDSSDGVYGTTKVTVTNIDGKDCHFNLLLLRTDTAAPKPYHYFTADVVLADDPTVRERYRDENIACAADVLSLNPSDRSVYSISSFFYGISHRMQNILYHNLDPETASFAYALLLADKSGLDPKIQRDFRTLGVSHTLAVSGLHLSVLTAAVLFLLGILHAGMKTRLAVMLIFMTMFVGLCGFTPSVLRASLMSAGLLVANIFGRRTSGLQTLCISLACILLFCPYLIYSVSLQLSALATLGILILFPLTVRPTPRKHKSSPIQKILRFFWTQCILTVSATAFTLPVLYVQFKAISLVGFIANLVFVPLITLVLYILPVFIICLPIPGLHTLLAKTVTGLYNCIRFCSNSANYCKDFYCYLPLAILIAIVIILLTVPLLYAYKRGKFAGISILLLIGTLFLCYPLSQNGTERLVYRYADNRQTLLLSAQNEVVLIETGNASKKNATAAMEQTLGELHQTGIDTLVLTHYHDASLSFVKYLSQNTYLDALYIPYGTTETDLQIQKQIENLATEQEITVHTYTSEQPIQPGGFSLRIYNDRLHRSTHPAQAIEIVSKGGRVLAADPSVFELEGIGSPDLSGVDHLIFLDSPPIDLYPLPAFRGQENVHAFYIGTEQYDLLGCPFGSYTILNEDQNTVIIHFSN